LCSHICLRCLFLVQLMTASTSDFGREVLF
jgi:hypothetical protein